MHYDAQNAVFLFHYLRLLMRAHMLIWYFYDRYPLRALGILSVNHRVRQSYAAGLG
jgi:hypothetical protein